VISSHLSPLELYSFLYKYREGHTIIFDDCSLLDNKTSQAILKSATYSPTGTRILRYMTSTPRLKVPSVYTFKSTIIFCVNKLPRLDEDFKAVLDRCLYYKLEIPYKDLIKIIADLVKLPHNKLNESERKEIFKFIKENSDETCNISLRTLYKIYSFYEYDKTKWEKLGLEILKPNEELQLIKRLIKESNTIKGACQEYIEKSGKSRASFFRLKREIYK